MDLNENKYQDEIIYSYTRKQAIEDGYQVKLEGEHAKTAKEAGYKWPVYMTSGVFGLIERAVANEKHCNDFTGVLWDICYMSIKTGRMLNDRLKEFTVIITGAGNKKYHTLLVECGAVDIDDPNPCLTFMLPEEN